MSTEKHKIGSVGVSPREREKLEDELEAKGQHVVRPREPETRPEPVQGVRFVTPQTSTARAALGPQSVAHAKKRIADKRRGR